MSTENTDSRTSEEAPVNGIAGPHSHSHSSYFEAWRSRDL